MVAEQEETPTQWRLPAQPGTLVGREANLAALTQALQLPDCRLLTLLGPGGIGKTRLAIAAAETLAEGFEDGVYFVDLTKATDPAEIPSLVAAELGARVNVGSSLERVKGFLRDRQLLLVLDNFEHVQPAAIMVSEILERCANVKVLATSREPLRLRWEQRVLLTPLAVPNGRFLPSEELRAIPSVALFLQRARAVNLRFAADDEVVQQIGSICSQLDGVPLAIELAAARTNVLSPAEMLERLNRQRALLRQNTPDAPARHQSLQATLDWSYQLLSESEKALFRRLGTFVGGFTLDAVESLAKLDLEGIDPVEVLSSLIDKGLAMVVPAAGGPGRYRLLEIVRTYALERLQDAGEAARGASAHALYYLDLAEAESKKLRCGGFLVFSPQGAPAQGSSPQSRPWPSALDDDDANLGAALHWAYRYDSLVLLRLTGALSRYWWVRGLLEEGARWLEIAVEMCADADPALLSRALGGLGPIYRQQGDFVKARSVMEQALDTTRALDDAQLAMMQLLDLAAVLGSQLQVRKGMALAEQALQYAEASEDTWGIAAAQAVVGMGEIILRNGQEAESHLSKSLPRFRELGDLRSVVVVEGSLARAFWLLGDRGRALSVSQLSLRLCQEIGHETLIPSVLELAVSLLQQEVSPEACARLLGAANRLRERGYARTILERQTYEETLARLTEVLDADALDGAMRAGRKGSGEEAITEVLALVEDAMPSHSPAETTGKNRTRLSKRELEVLALLAEGCPNKQIGERLGISENTAKFHVASILNTLSVTSRLEAVSLAMRRGLV